MMIGHARPYCVHARYQILYFALYIEYRPPECPEQSFKSCTSFISDYCDSVSDDFELNILGDFNFPRVNWSSHTVLPGDSESEQRSTKLLFDFMSDYLCDQVITEPTRLDRTLDLYLTNSEELITHVSCSSTPLSDHDFVEIYWSHNPCNLSPPAPPDFSMSTFHSLNFLKADYPLLNCMISSVDWKELWDLSENINEFVEPFTLTILQICEICCPKKVACRKKTNHSLNILNRKRRKLKSRLKSAEENPRSPTTQIASLQNKLAFIHVDIRDAINSDLLYREQQAVGKIKENQKYFYSYTKQFSTNKIRKASACCLTTKVKLKRPQKNSLIYYKSSSFQYLVIPLRQTGRRLLSTQAQFKFPLQTSSWNLQSMTL